MRRQIDEIRVITRTYTLINGYITVILLLRHRFNRFYERDVPTSSLNNNGNK